MTAVTIVGMISGALLLLTAIGIIIVKKEIPVGGVALAIVSLIFIGMSQWSNIQFEALGVKFSALSEAISQTASAADEVAAQAEQAAAEVAATKSQLSALTRHIEARGVLAPALTRPIEDKLSATPAVDREKLARARKELKRLAEIKR